MILNYESAVKEGNRVIWWRVAGETIFNKLARECLSGEETCELKPEGWERRAHWTVYGCAGCSLHEHLSNERIGPKIHFSFSASSQAFQHGISSLERRGALICFSQRGHMGCIPYSRETVLGTKIAITLNNYFFQSHPRAWVSLGRLYLKHKWHFLYNCAIYFFILRA